MSLVVVIDNGLVIDKQKIAKPAADTTTIIADGSPKTYAIAIDNRYIVNENIQTEAGNYTVFVSLKDTVNYEWADGSIDDLSYSFTIRQSQLSGKVDDNSEKDDIIVSSGNGFEPNVVIEVKVVPQGNLTQAIQENVKEN